MTYESYTDLYGLGEVSFVAGTTYNIDFKLADPYGYPMNLYNKLFTWQLSPFGEKNTVTLSKTGVNLVTDEYTVRISLTSSDTQNLSGKYIQQISFTSDELLVGEPEELIVHPLDVVSEFVTVGITQPSFPRLIVAQHSNPSASGGWFSIFGTDIKDRSIYEHIWVDGQTLTSTLVFKTITQLIVPGWVADGDVITVSGGDYYGVIIPAQGIITVSPQITS